MLSETLAQYSALMVMKQLYGEDKIRRFLKFELDRYLRGRGGEVVEELPLVRVENQDYIHYRKGSLVMYLLQERLGEDGSTARCATLLDRYRFKGAPYPRSLDLVEALRAEATTPEEQALITDLFERITLYDLKVDRADRGPARRRPVGRHRAGRGAEVLRRRQGQRDARRRSPSASRSACSPPSPGAAPSTAANVIADGAPAPIRARQAGAAVRHRPEADPRRRRPLQLLHRPQLGRQCRAGDVMRLALRCHPDSRCLEAIRIDVEAVRSGSVLSLDFRLIGDNRGLLTIPDPATPAFRVGLWKHSCFEGFIRPNQGNGYCELNLSPSGEWAAYAFDKYRDGMRPVDPLPALAIAVARSDSLIELKAQMDLNGVSALPADRSWRLGLSAVIEDVDGNKSYWALAHPPGRRTSTIRIALRSNFRHREGHEIRHRPPARRPRPARAAGRAGASRCSPIRPRSPRT